MSEFTACNRVRGCMGRLLTIMLAAAMLPALGQAQTVNICDRTPQVRDAIMAAAGAEDCAAVDSESLAGVTLLSGISWQGLTSLRADDFDGLTSLQALWLNGNQLAALPEGIFDSLTSLQTLILSSNQLAELPDGVFDGLTSLQRLDLNNNQLAELPDGAFDGLTSLQRLILSGIQLAELPDGAFDGLTSLQRLDLSGNQLAELPEGIFDSLTSLQTLELSGNQLAALPDGVFDGLTSLQTLLLGSNQLAALPEGAFDGLTSLQTLYLYYNQLAALPDGAFDGLTSLQRLELSGNQLAALPEGIFDGLTSLQELYLSGNRLAELPEGLFAGLTGLQRLDLDENQLAALPEGIFDGLTGLQELDLSGNHLVGLTANDPLFAGLSSLVDLALGRQTTAISVCDRTPQVRDAIMAAGDAANCAAVGAARVTSLNIAGQGLTSLRADDFAGLTSLQELRLSGNQLAALPEGAFDGLTSLQELWLSRNQLAALPEGAFDGLTGLQLLVLQANRLTALPEGLFAGLTGLQALFLDENQLAELPEGLFAGLTGLQRLWLSENQLAELPEGIFDGLTGLQRLWLSENQLAELPEGLFAGLTGLQYLYLSNNQLAALPEGAFDGLTGLQELYLSGNQLAALPEGAFDGLTSLRWLYLFYNQLAELPEGIFDGLTGLQYLYLFYNQLAELPEGIFDGLTGLQYLYLSNNQLAELPEGAFDGLTSLKSLWLQSNHFVGLTLNDPLFAGLPDGVDVRLDTRLAAAVPFMPSASDSMRQGFVRIINESGASGSVRILAFDDGGNAANPIEIQLGAGQSVHFNSSDLENGNANKGIEGVGPPAQGDWRLDIEAALAVRVLSFVRTGDGFLTAMHDRLLRFHLYLNKFLALAETFNPGSNDQSVSSLRLVNTGGSAESVSIEGVDDQGNAAGPVTLTLAAGEARTLSALDLETGNAQGLTGTLGDGKGKWRLFITAGQSVVGASLLKAATGHVTNLSTWGVSTWGVPAIAAAVPFMPSASDSMRQGFVRIINGTTASGSVRILAFDDGGNAANPIEIQLGAGQSVHFNSSDLENGNPNKGIEGVGPPAQGDWRLDIESALNVTIIAFVRTGDGFLTAMHGRLLIARPGQSRRAAWTFNPGSNDQSVSSLRLVNTGGSAESVSIEGVDDQGNAAGPVTLTLAAGEARTLSALDLETGNAQGLTGTLGDGGGKWRLFITAEENVVGASLLRAATGHVTNLSTAGEET